MKRVKAFFARRVVMLPLVWWLSYIYETQGFWAFKSHLSAACIGYVIACYYSPKTTLR